MSNSATKTTPTKAVQATSTPEAKKLTLKVGPNMELAMSLSTLVKWGVIFATAATTCFTAREAVRADVKTWFATEKGGLVSQQTFSETVTSIQTSANDLKISQAKTETKIDALTRSLERTERIVEMIAFRQGVPVPAKASATAAQP